jgi:hypothetical protein
LTLLPDHVSSSNWRPRQSNSNTKRDGTLTLDEPHYPAVQYIRRKDVDMAQLKSMSTFPLDIDA